MQLNDLRAFVLTVELGNVTRAAARMNRVQSAVSQAIGRLQKEFGVELILRGQTGMHPTTAGEHLAKSGQIILDMVDRLDRDVRSYRSSGEHPNAGQLVGTLELGMATSLTPILLSRMLRALSTAEPRLRVHVKEGLNAELVRQVVEHRLDLGIVWLPAAAEGLEIKPLGTTPLALITRANHPLARGPSVRISDLASQPFISFSKGTVGRSWVEGTCIGAGFVPDIRIEVEHLSEAKAFVEAGVGVTLLPPGSVRLERKSGMVSVIPLAGATFQPTFGYAWAPNWQSPAADAARAAIGLLDRAFEKRREEAATTLPTS